MALAMVLPGISTRIWAAPTEYVRTQFVADVEAIEPGQVFRLGVRFEIEDLWHIYGPQKQEFGLPTEMKLTLPEGFEAGPVQYPETKRFEDLGLESFGYESEVLLQAEVTAPPELEPGEMIEFEAACSWLVCKIDGQCIPGRTTLQLALPVGQTTPSAQAALFDQYAAQVPTAPDTSPAIEPEAAETPAPTPDAGTPISANEPPFSFLEQRAEKTQYSLVVILFYALLGGLILNVMPCVLPVLSIKVLSFVQQAGEERARVFALGLVFAAGVLVSFAALATVVVILQGLGQTLGWGFQFSEPRFIVFMSAIILAFSLSLFGVYSINLPGAAMQGAYGLQAKEGPAGAFFNGVLATALATPCTAPLLGPALGFAFSQPFWVIYLIFFTIAAGLALPYLLLAAFPQWLSFMPKPGAWMETFKQFMGFPLLATVVWLMWLFGKTSGGADGIVALTAFLVCVSLAFWIIGRGTGLTVAPSKRTVSMMLAVLILISAYVWFPERHLRWLHEMGMQQVEVVAEDDWEPFSVERVEELVAQNRTVFIDFTADWCLTCMVNEKAVLAQPKVKQAFEDKNVALLKADYTRQPPDLTHIIRYFGRAGVPLYLIFPAGHPQDYTVLPEALTPGMVVDNLP